ncbi:MAG TPA: hypothetical protein VMF66_18090 [Candidatus Acidoferrum sp.]|nr:hypothetical protein [Candidatus Acidoferrum sp.]
MYPASKLLSRGSFQVFYWTEEFICVVAGYALVMEIIERAFAYYEGPKRLGRNAALITLAAIVAFTSFQAAAQRLPGIVHTSTQVEANLRGAELLLLVIIITVISYYSVPVGRNLKGIIIGYGICTLAVAVNEAVMNLAGARFQVAFSTIWSYSFVVPLVIWTVMLWSYEPNPVPTGWTQMAGDYEALARRTKATLAGVVGYLRKGVRS